MRIAKYVGKQQGTLEVYNSVRSTVVFEFNDDGVNLIEIGVDDLGDLIHDLQRFYNELKHEQIKKDKLKKTPKLPTK